jgi:hypothetical protein
VFVFGFGFNVMQLAGRNHLKSHMYREQDFGHMDATAKPSQSYSPSAIMLQQVEVIVIYVGPCGSKRSLAVAV